MLSLSLSLSLFLSLSLYIYRFYVMIFYFSQIGNLPVDSKTAKIIICQNLYKITSVKI